MSGDIFNGHLKEGAKDILGADEERLGPVDLLTRAKQFYRE